MPTEAQTRAVTELGKLHSLDPELRPLLLRFCLRVGLARDDTTEVLVALRLQGWTSPS